ncbi:class II aaRS and biotin synthetase [Xylaria venustula]|nr:class II aaRS and biotin synthetase [Xylaria venustula]
MVFSLRSTPKCCHSLQIQARISQRRFINSLPTSYPPNNFSRLSNLWLITGGIAPIEHEDGHAKLVRAGYLRQSHAGIFHTLPLGERVQRKLEGLIDKYMSQLGASKVSLSSISSQALWEKTNRLEGYGQELFRFTDRKDVPYILAPTHEEEITTLVANNVKSYKNLPLRLYQIGRKYRDEIRPRHGVLRSREFVMKDLYTFDYSLQSALKTYDEARAAYNRLFDELKLPYLVAEASSGDIGGDLSHEYHLPSSIGEDNVISCIDCDYVANEELATARPDYQAYIDAEGAKPGIDAESTNPTPPGAAILQHQSGIYTPELRSTQELRPDTAGQVWSGISKDRKTLVSVWYPRTFEAADINTHALKSVVPDLDTSIEDALPLWESIASTKKRKSPPPQMINIIDYRLGEDFVNVLREDPNLADVKFITSSPTGEPFNAIRIRDGDACPRCTSGKLTVQKAIELGHTFHLGTKYSDVLGARVHVPASLVEDSQVENSNQTKDNNPAEDSSQAASSTSAKSGSAVSVVGVSMQMGCHGIGVSRIIGAVADHLSDKRGLSWPRAIAPFEVVVIPGKHTEEDVLTVIHSLTQSQPSDTSNIFPPIDLALDDRADSFPRKLKDADVVGYPVIVILGRQWASDRLCEVQCRRLGSTESIGLDRLQEHVNGLLAQL